MSWILKNARELQVIKFDRPMIIITVQTQSPMTLLLNHK